MELCQIVTGSHCKAKRQMESFQVQGVYHATNFFEHSLNYPILPVVLSPDHFELKIMFHSVPKCQVGLFIFP